MNATSILKSHKIRQTDCRKDILGEFITRGYALSQPDLERAVGTEFDRVTIYRTLSLYLDKGIIHKVLDDKGAMKYALCPETCSEHHHHHEHVHFKCSNCSQTTCLDHVELPSFSLPGGYQVKESNLLLQGICPKCA